MGQYYLIVNVDKKQYLHPHQFGEGMKLLEFGCDGMGAMTALAVLLADGNGRGGGDLQLDVEEAHDDDALVGSWAGNRIVVAGDYADSFQEQLDATGHHFAEGLLTRKEQAALQRKIREENGDPGFEFMRMNLHSLAGWVFEDISLRIKAVMTRNDEYLRSKMSPSLAEKIAAHEAERGGAR